MQRVVIDVLPDKSTNDYELIFTPTKPIARSIKASHLTLESIAKTIIQKKGLKIASVLLTCHLLQKAIKTILQVKDFDGFYRELAIFSQNKVAINWLKQQGWTIIEGNYPIAPDLQFLACNYCKFDLVCRKK